MPLLEDLESLAKAVTTRIRLLRRPQRGRSAQFEQYGYPYDPKLPIHLLLWEMGSVRRIATGDQVVVDRPSDRVSCSKADDGPTRAFGFSSRGVPSTAARSIMAEVIQFVDGQIPDGATGPNILGLQFPAVDGDHLGLFNLLSANADASVTGTSDGILQALDGLGFGEQPAVLGRHDPSVQSDLAQYDIAGQMQHGGGGITKAIQTGGSVLLTVLPPQYSIPLGIVLNYADDIGKGIGGAIVDADLAGRQAAAADRRAHVDAQIDAEIATQQGILEQANSESADAQVKIDEAQAIIDDPNTPDDEREIAVGMRDRYETAKADADAKAAEAQANIDKLNEMKTNEMPVDEELPDDPEMERQKAKLKASPMGKLLTRTLEDWSAEEMALTIKMWRSGAPFTYPNPDEMPRGPIPDVSKIFDADQLKLFVEPRSSSTICAKERLARLQIAMEILDPLAPKLGNPVIIWGPDGPPPTDDPDLPIFFGLDDPPQI